MVKEEPGHRHGRPRRSGRVAGAVVSRNTAVRDDLGVPIPRVVVADLSGAAEERALRRAREVSADGEEVVYLGASQPVATAWVVRAEDAGRVLVVADDAAAQALRAALAELGIDDVALEVLPPD